MTDGVSGPGENASPEIRVALPGMDGNVSEPETSRDEQASDAENGGNVTEDADFESESSLELVKMEPRPEEEEEEEESTDQETEAGRAGRKPDSNSQKSDDRAEEDDDGEGDEVAGGADGDVGDEEEETEVEGGEDDDDDDDDDGDDEDEDDEPILKNARLTQHLGAVYRNADMTSAFLVASDKMVIGTHNGIIHAIQLPTFQSLRVYQAHSTSVTSVSVSPYPLPSPPTHIKPEVVNRAISLSLPPSSSSRPASRQSERVPVHGGSQRKAREPPQIPNIPSNNIHIATASMDGNVCVQNVFDMKEVSLRNFARPVQAVAISPDYKNDRTYISGGIAGSLILTINPPQGKSTSTLVGTAAAAAAGWLGTMGIGSNTGKDTVLHSGEGTISAIKWSLSGKYVVWLNEHGIKIMRTRLHLDTADSEHAWKRIGHIDRPQTDEWEVMAGVWKGRAEWIDEQAIEAGEDWNDSSTSASKLSPTAAKLRQTAVNSDKKIERLLVGWGGTIWIINVHPDGVGVGKHAGEWTAGRAEIVKKLRVDCIISGISLYTQNLLLILAYCKPDDDHDHDDAHDDNDVDAKKHAKGDQPKLQMGSGGSEPSGGRRRRRNALAPELRLIDLVTQAEVDRDTLEIGRFEALTSNDYHLGILPANNVASVVASKGVLESMAGIGTDMWNVAINPKSLFSSGASVRSKDSNDGASSTRMGGSTAGSLRTGMGARPNLQSVHPNLTKPGAKIFIHSPYDCIMATKRDLSDHLAWLLEHQRYQDAWTLLDEHPEIMASVPEKLFEAGPTTPGGKSQQSSEDFFDDTTSILDAQIRTLNSPAEKEKRRIGELWIQELVEAESWIKAAEVAAKVLNTSDRWEKWIYTFAGAKRFDEIVKYIPSEPMMPPIPSTIYEIVLGHYIQTDKPRFKELLERWGPELFGVHTIITALENQLKFRDVREDSVEDGEKGRDWRLVLESLARLYEANGQYKDALRTCIKLQDADSVMRLIRDHHLADAVIDDVASFITLRVPESRLPKMGISELDEATSETIALLVEEAERGLIKPDTVVRQLEAKSLDLYLYFYFRGLWIAYRERSTDEAICLLDNFADTAVHLFAQHDRELLMDFLKSSTSYNFEKAVQECEAKKYVPELVYLYSVTGQMKRALYLIIDRLGDVSQAISFAKEQDDPDLWEDLLNYSMDKPRFIHGLLEEVGTAINPITLVRRIPEGLEIPGLREGLKHIMKEHEIQHSISSGVARVLRSEVAAAQSMLRLGQQKGIKFELIIRSKEHVDVEVKDPPTILPAGKTDSSGAQTPALSRASAPTSAPTVASDIAADVKQQPDHDHRTPQPGHCARCHQPFTVWEMEPLVGFACGHAFHVTHLLEFLHPGQKPDPNIVSYGSGFEDGEGGRTRRVGLVGSKVTHTRLLKDRIGSGCPVCRDRREAVDGARV